MAICTFCEWTGNECIDPNGCDSSIVKGANQGKQLTLFANVVNAETLPIIDREEKQSGYK